MFKNLLLASSLLASFAFAGCAQPAEQSTGDIAIEETDLSGVGKADHLSLSITEIFPSVDHSLLVQGGSAIVTSADSYADYFGAQAPADIDFDHEWVAFYGIGTRNSGGFSASITSLSALPSWNGNGLLMETDTKSPGSDCFVTMAITTPHTIVKFERPQVMPEWFTMDSTSEVYSCTPSNADHLDELAAAREVWEQKSALANASYQYESEFLSFLGFGSRTTIVVDEGVVTERHYKSQHTNGGDATVWSEFGAAELGSNVGGEAPVVMEALYDECETEILTLDTDEYFISFAIDSEGLLSSCQASNKLCADDCSFGPSISSITFEEASCECDGPIPEFQPRICLDGSMIFPSMTCEMESATTCGWDFNAPSCPEDLDF